MEKATVRAMWNGAMFGIALLCLAVMFVALLGCGDAPEQPQEPVIAPALAEREPIEDFIEEGTPEQDEAARELLAPFRGLPHRDIVFDRDERYEPMRAQLPKGRAPVEKAAYAALTGWALTGRLQYQNGLFDAGETAPEGDHCTYFGLSCSDDWRAQAKLLVLDQGNFARNFRGSCGSQQMQSDGLNNFWMPCMNVYLTESEKDLTYWYDEASCKRVSGSNNAVKIIRDGAAAWAAYLTRYTAVSMTATADPNFASLYIGCSTTLGEETMGMWQPHGNLTLRYGGTVAGYTPGGQELSATTREGCETRNTPGYPAQATYTQGLDLMYSYDYGNLWLGYKAMFEKFAECSDSNSQLVRGVRNTLIHEFGHHVGFGHDLWEDLDTGIMVSAGMICEDMVDYSMGFSDSHLQALQVMDMNAQGQGGELELWDVDMSCFIPTGYDDPRGPTLGGVGPIP